MRPAATFAIGLGVGAIATIGALAWTGQTPGIVDTVAKWSRPARGPNDGGKVRSQSAPVRALGTLEPGGGSTYVGSPLMGARIVAVRVKENDLVEKGATLLELDSAAVDAEAKVAEMQIADAKARQAAELAIAKRRVETSKKTVAQLAANRDTELSVHQQKANVAKLRAEQSKKEVARLEALRQGSSPLASGQQIEQAKLAADLAAAESDAAAVAVKRAEQQLDFERDKAQLELDAALDAERFAQDATPIEILEQKLSLAQLRKQEAKVAAPSGGRVVGVTGKIGELVGAAPLVQLADLDKLTCVAEVDVADLRRLGVEQGSDKPLQAKLRCRAFGDHALDATVERVGTIVGAAALRPIDPRRSIDRGVAKVTLVCDAAKARELLGAADGDVALMGLQVDVEFEKPAAPGANAAKTPAP